MRVFWLAVAAVAAVAAGMAVPAQAQFQQGGVDHPGEWHVGEGIQAGDFYSYSMCHVDYKECAEFRMDMWIEGTIQVGTEEKWLAQVVVYDGSHVVVGDMELGKIAPEPTGGSAELGVYRGAFKSSVVWLSAFANANEPKKFAMPSWGKIANIGGEQILPKEVIEGGLDTPAGHFDDIVLIGWRTGGANSQVWVSDGFPFPLKALTWTHVSEGIPPKEYEFELREYRTGVVENPLAGIASTAQQQAAQGCPDTGMLEQSVKRPTSLFRYQLHVFYSPDPLVEDCPVRMLVKFISKYDDTQFLNQVQYDLWVVDVDAEGNPLTPPIRSIADEEGRFFLYSPSGQAEIDFTADKAGTVNYLVYVYGLSPENIVPGVDGTDYLLLPLDVYPRMSEQSIPAWIKNTALWWAQGQIDDESFVQGLQYLIREGILAVPPTDPDGSGEPGPIPDWIKNTALWWAQGHIDDDAFVQGLQYLMQTGIIRIS